MSTSVNKIPESTTDFIKDVFGVTYFQRFKAFNMNLLYRWENNEWKVASYLPWDELQPISKIQST